MKQNLCENIQSYSLPFESKLDLRKLVEQMEDSTIVLLGESSHGTSEFYKVRSEITKMLIEEKGFSFIAVEGDWPSCQAVNRFIKGYDSEASAKEVLSHFERWPTWMWANEEIMELVDWLQKHNQTKAKNKQVGFYGLDVYSMWESMDEILKYFEESGLTEEYNAAKKAFACFEHFQKNSEKYAVSAAFFSEGCADEVVTILKEIQTNKHKYTDEFENSLNLEINALVAANAEKHYRTVVISDIESWNIRDRHMVSALNKIRNFYGKDAKVIIWEHNTHVGDARATDMINDGMVNVGQLIREQENSENVYIVGFGTYEGTVIASSEWGLNIERMQVPPAQENSWEDMLHRAGAYDKMLIFNDQNRRFFNETIGHRAIGAVYHPEYEMYGNYVPSNISERYDAFIFIDHSNALHPLNMKTVHI